MDFSSLIPALQSGRIDFIMAGLNATEERLKNMDFSDVYYNNSLVLVVHQEGVWSDEPDFKGKKIGAQLGSTMENLQRKWHLDIRVCLLFL